MIFIAKNEKGEPSWKLVLEGNKTVTRRVKSLPVGKDFAVCPGRGKFAICRAEVIDCIPHQKWIIKKSFFLTEPNDAVQILENEAHKEGFNSWHGLIKWFRDKGINIDDTYRIEFKVL